MPRVALDLRMVQGRLHGIARYALELAHRLPVLRPDWDWIGLTGPEGISPSFSALAPRMALEASSAGFLSPLEQPALAASLRRLAPTLFHATSFSLPALWRGRLVATLHDANHLALPHLYGTVQRLYYRWVVRPRARTAVQLLTVSEFSRREIAHYFRIPPAQIEVTALGVSEGFQPLPSAVVDRFRERHGLPERYFVAVGNPKAHKNLALLASIAAHLPAPLVLLAGPGAAHALGFPLGTIDLGELAEEELPPLYSGALALLLPSVYEGFGLPALEAMACGCPVVAARASALAEWVEGAGLLLDPYSPEAWLGACRELAENVSLRDSLRDRGHHRTERFSWDRCAKETLKRYEWALQLGG